MLASVIASFRSEWILLNRRALWTAVVTIALVLGVAATWLVLDTADGSSQAAVASGPTSAVMTAMSFIGLLVAVSFAALAGTEIDRGLFRVSLTRQPRRAALIAGHTAARLAVAAVLGLVVLLGGAATAFVVGPSVGVDTGAWSGLHGLSDAVQDAGRLALFVAVYAAIGTAVAVVIRNTPISLAVLLVWFGPIENVVGRDADWAQRWFPGLVVRSLLDSGARSPLSTTSAAWTSAVFIAVCAAVTVVAVSRRDVTS